MIEIRFPRVSVLWNGQCERHRGISNHLSNTVELLPSQDPLNRNPISEVHFIVRAGPLQKHKALSREEISCSSFHTLKRKRLRWVNSWLQQLIQSRRLANVCSGGSARALRHYPHKTSSHFTHNPLILYSAHPAVPTLALSHEPASNAELILRQGEIKGR